VPFAFFISIESFDMVVVELSFLTGWMMNVCLFDVNSTFLPNLLNEILFLSTFIFAPFRFACFKSSETPSSVMISSLIEKSAGGVFSPSNFMLFLFPNSVRYLSRMVLSFLSLKSATPLR